MNENKKSTAIQSVKTVAVLVVICLVCCLLLSVCNDLFYISDEERFQRSMAKIYPNFVKDDAFDSTLNFKFKTNSNYGEVKSVVRSTDGAYIVEALGNGGYSGGTVTLYVVVGSDAKIVGWTVKENVGQSYISRIPSNAGQTWYVGEDVSNDLSLNMSGATVVATSTAINHAVNMAAYYCRNVLGVGKNPEADAQKALLEFLADTDYASCTFTSNSALLEAKLNGQTVAEMLSEGSDTLSYVFTPTGDEQLLAFVYGTDENRKIVVLNNDGTVVKQSDDTIELVSKAQALVSFKIGTYQAFAWITSQDRTSDEGTYTVVGLKVGTTPDTYVLQVTVEPDSTQNRGKVKKVTVSEDGYVAGGDPSRDDANKLSDYLVGATLDTIDGLYNANKVNGATQSANLITVAVKAALARFDAPWVTAKEGVK